MIEADTSDYNALSLCKYGFIFRNEEYRVCNQSSLNIFEENGASDTCELLKE
jgi:hypothetical protein